jgi:hypothetical protein
MKDMVEGRGSSLSSLSLLFLYRNNKKKKGKGEDGYRSCQHQKDHKDGEDNHRAYGDGFSCPPQIGESEAR